MTLDQPSVFAIKLQQHDGDLNLMARPLLLIALGVDLEDPRPTRQSAQPTA
jgi:hypothetical protein